MSLKLWMWLGIGWLLAACAGAPEPVATEHLITNTSTSAQLITPTLEPPPQPTSAPIQPVTLSLWFPVALAPLDNVDAAELLSEQISRFRGGDAQTERVTVDFRLKTADQEGGIMATLRTASAVAPGAMPHVTLVRRSDLVAAVEAGLIVPIGEGSSTARAVLANYAPIVQRLGRVDGILYGLPYNIDVQHVVYAGDTAPTTMFAAELTDSLPILFPAGATNTISDVLLAQYREAADMLDDDQLTLDVDPLRIVFTYYERAVEAGLIDAAVLEYTQPADYADLLASGDVAGVVTSSMYLNMGDQVLYAPLPTQSGAGATVVDGWMWVITTRDVEEQALALRFIGWMMDVERQAAYHQAIGVLPSQTNALNRWSDADYAVFVEGLLEQGTLPLVDGDSANRARAIASAFAAVLAGRESAITAASEVASQLNP
ncbi:MAG: extracellular solute-binding protein [Anaerolinea sp.]|nr:extracellular solute-binding protein [Anaerolinea sp.]